MLLPHAQAARALTCLACLRARLHFEEGRNAEALDDIFAAMTLARHVSLDGSLITVLVGYSIESRAGVTLAQYLPKLNAATIKGLTVRLDALPPFGTPASALLSCELETLNWFVRKVEEAKDKESLLVFLSKLLDTREKGLALLKECGGTAAGVLKFADETRPSYALMAAKLELPLDQFEKEYEREAKRQAGNPVFNVLFPAVTKIRASQTRTGIRRTLLAAAIAVQQGGQGALKNHPDPAVGGPFEYVAFDGGFELSSKWKLDEPNAKPVSLTVGLRGK